MNLRDMIYFCAVADMSHFGRAAEACHVSQPTLSAQIKKLEEELGVVLFERSNRSVRLTPAGGDILPIARRIKQAATDIKRTAESHRDPFSGHVAIGVIPTAAPALIPDIVRGLRDSLPQMKHGFVEDLTDGLIARLERGAIDAAILATEVPGQAFDEIQLYDEPFLLACPERHRLATARHLTPTSIDPDELLLLSEGHCFRVQALSFCRVPTGVAAGAELQATSLETILNIVSAGVGITLVPARTAHATPLMQSGIAVRAFDDAGKGEASARRMRLVFRATSPRRRLMKAIADTIRGGAPDCVRLVKEGG
ncbi:MAG: LysR substrate-binding domain-containing protein [Alphaproteobacteria bacterium]|nr:LysR substrate-binding domain-containing protein [Alphaproteobacteria bacterium]